MHSPEASLIYPYLRLFYWLTGDYVLGMKVGTAILSGMFTGTLFWAARNRVQNQSAALPPVLLTAWSVFSPHLTYFSAQYSKNLLGVVLLLAFMGSLAAEQRVFKISKLGKEWILPAILLLANYFAHRLTFSLTLVYLLWWLFFRFKNPVFKKAFSLKILFLGSAALVLLVVVAGWIFPGLFHFADLGRLSGVLTWKPQFAPWSFVSQFGLERISGWWLFEVCIVSGFWFLLFCYWLLLAGYRLLVIGKSPPIPHLQSPVNQSLFWLCALLMFPFLEWSLTGIAWRFFLVFILITPLLVIDCQFIKSKRSGVVFAVALLCCSLFSWKSYNPEWHDPDYALFAATTEKAQPLLREENPELVIAHNALAEYFTFTTGTDAMPWAPEYEVDSSRLLRITAGIKLQTLRYYAGSEKEALVQSLGYVYCILPEYVWQAILQQAKIANDELLLSKAENWRNPSQVRPGWLLSRKRGL